MSKSQKLFRTKDMPLFQTDFQGGPVFEVFSAHLAKKEPQRWTISGPSKGVKEVYDKTAKGYIYTNLGGPTTKIQVPKDDRKGCYLVQKYLVLQVFVQHDDSFTIEIRLLDTTNSIRRLVLSTSFSEISVNPLHARVPLGMLVRGEWLNLCIDVSGIVTGCWTGKATSNVKMSPGIPATAKYLKHMDLLVISPKCKLRKILTSKDALPDTTSFYEDIPLGVPVAVLPRKDQYPIFVNHVTQFINFPRILAFLNQHVAAPTEVEAPSTAIPVKLLSSTKRDYMGPMHLAFGHRTPALPPGTSGPMMVPPGSQGIGLTSGRMSGEFGHSGDFGQESSSLSMSGRPPRPGYRAVSQASGKAMKDPQVRGYDNAEYGFPKTSRVASASGWHGEEIMAGVPPSRIPRPVSASAAVRGSGRQDGRRPNLPSQMAQRGVVSTVSAVRRSLEKRNEAMRRSAEKVEVIREARSSGSRTTSRVNIATTEASGSEVKVYGNVSENSGGRYWTGSSDRYGQAAVPDVNDEQLAAPNTQDLEDQVVYSDGGSGGEGDEGLAVEGHSEPVDYTAQRSSHFVEDRAWKAPAATSQMAAEAAFGRSGEQRIVRHNQSSIKTVEVGDQVGLVERNPTTSMEPETPMPVPAHVRHSVDEDFQAWVMETAGKTKDSLTQGAMVDDADDESRTKRLLEQALFEAELRQSGERIRLSHDLDSAGVPKPTPEHDRQKVLKELEESLGNFVSDVGSYQREVEDEVVIGGDASGNEDEGIQSSFLDSGLVRVGSAEAEEQPSSEAETRKSHGAGVHLPLASGSLYQNGDYNDGGESAAANPLSARIMEDRSLSPPVDSALGDDDDGNVSGGAEETDELDLVYDPALDCYFDPSTNQYYKLK